MLTELERKNLIRNIAELQNTIADIDVNKTTANDLLKASKLINERTWELTLLAGKLSSRESKI